MMLSHQVVVDEMLLLGRSIIGQPFVFAKKESLPNTLTEFIQEWSNLSMDLQTWHDNLFEQKKQSDDLVIQFDELCAALQEIKSLFSNFFPAMVGIDNFLLDMQRLKVSVYHLPFWP